MKIKHTPKPSRFPLPFNSKLVITVCVFIFLVLGTFLAIKWAEGYRLDISKQIIEGTGLLVANSSPQGASVYINGELESATDDTLHLPPGQYDIRIEKEGYSPWQKNITIEKELVTQTNARLFPFVPNLSAITVNSATDPHPSPDGQKIAYKIASGSAVTKHGIWVTNLNDNPLRFGSNSIQIITNTRQVKFTDAKLFWAPNSNQILAYINENEAYLLNATTFNDPDKLINDAFQLTNFLSDWQQQLSLEFNKRLTKLPPEMQKIATTSAALQYFSPNEEKLLFVATASATIADNLIPPLPAINFQVQERTIQPGNIYVYDLVEDTNFLVAKNIFTPEMLQDIQTTYPLIKMLTPEELQTLATGSAIAPVNTTTFDTNRPILDQLMSIQAQYSPIYTPMKLQWFPDSRHLILISDSQISILEYDGANTVSLFSAPFVDQFAYPWPNGEKLIILTSLSSNPGVLANLYVMNLK